MKKRFDDYRRLGRGFFGCSSLWLDSHHLLYVRGSGVIIPFTEQYFRFELTKIQGIVLTQTRTGLFYLLMSILGLVVGGLAGGAAVIQGAGTLHDGRYVYFCLGGIFIAMAVVSLIGLVLNVMWGPTCVCRVQTAVRSEKLRAIGRMRHGKKVFSEVQPLIDAAQEGIVAVPKSQAPSPPPVPDIVAPGSAPLISPAPSKEESASDSSPPSVSEDEAS